MPARSNNDRADVSLAALIRETARLDPQGVDLRGCCPVHRDPSCSLYVSTILDRFHCYGCGAEGDAVRWIMIRDGIDKKAAAVCVRRWLAGGTSASD